MPRVDDTLVRPETREEMVRGQMVHAAPALAPHADRHHALDFVTGGCVARGFVASSDLLTRASLDSNFATDTCIRREGTDPRTGARYLEELAFEIVNEQSRRDITVRAQDLSRRGVRRIIAIFVKRGEVGEWSAERNEWSMLDPNGVLEDPTLAEPIPIRALLDTEEASRAVIRGLHAKGDPELRSIEDRAAERGRAEGVEQGRAEGVEQGREEGLEQGRLQVSRIAVEALCEVLSIPIGADQRASLQQMNAAQIRVLLERILHERRWP